MNEVKTKNDLVPEKSSQNMKQESSPAADSNLLPSDPSEFPAGDNAPLPSNNEQITEEAKKLNPSDTPTIHMEPSAEGKEENQAGTMALDKPTEQSTESQIDIAVTNNKPRSIILFQKKPTHDKQSGESEQNHVQNNIAMNTESTPNDAASDKQPGRSEMIEVKTAGTPHVSTLTAQRLTSPQYTQTHENAQYGNRISASFRANKRFSIQNKQTATHRTWLQWIENWVKYLIGIILDLLKTFGIANENMAELDRVFSQRIGLEDWRQIMKPTFSRAEEKQLIRRIAERDHDASAILFDRYAEEIFGFLARRSNGLEAEDLLQEVFVRAFRGASTFRFESSLRTWLFAIARFVLIEHRRDIMDLHDEIIEESLTPGPERVAIGRQTQRDVVRALQSIPDDHSVVLVLHRVDGIAP